MKIEKICSRALCILFAISALMQALTSFGFLEELPDCIMTPVVFGSLACGSLWCVLRASKYALQCEERSARALRWKYDAFGLLSYFLSISIVALGVSLVFVHFRMNYIEIYGVSYSGLHPLLKQIVLHSVGLGVAGVDYGTKSEGFYCDVVFVYMAILV